MADYIYLMETRMTPAQGRALAAVRDVARSESMTVFLVGGAVRDLTSGSAIRDLDVVVQGDARQLRQALEAAGGTFLGESATDHSLHFAFPGGVRLEVGSTLSVSYPKPGKPVSQLATIQEDLRRRDFTANAMAVSLNEGSYGLLMDPLNGVADTENRELRLVSNYGFIEDPVRLLRAQRLASRLGWQLEEKTQQRYDTGKVEDYISALSAEQRGRELEAIFQEEDPLRTLMRLEAEGWSAALFAALQAKKVNEADLTRVRDAAGQLEAAGIFPDTAAANFGPLTAKLSADEVSELKSLLARPGFVEQIEGFDAGGKKFTAEFTSKAAALPSDAWTLLKNAVPEQVLAMAYGSKSPAVQAKLKAFFTDWPAARNRLPYQLMSEMRITPEVGGYDELLEKLFFELMNGKLGTVEEMRAYLEPYSPPAPPPPPNLRRRAPKREAKSSKSRSKKAAAVAASPEEATSPDQPAEAAVEAKPAVDENKSAAKAGSAAKKALADKVPQAGAAPAKQVPAKQVPVAKQQAKPAASAAQQAPKPAAAAKGQPPVAGDRKQPEASAKKAAPEKLPAKAGKSSKSVASTKSTARPAAKKESPTTKRPAAKKAAPAKKDAGKKVAAKKPVAVKAAATQKKSASAKKAAPAKKSAVKKSAAKTSAAGKSAAKKQAPAKTARKAAAKQPAKNAAGKKTSAPAKKVATRKR